MNNSVDIFGKVLLAAGTVAILTAQAAGTGSGVRTVTSSWLAPELYREGMIEHVCLVPDAQAISLVDRVLVQNDACGAGKSNLGPETEVIEGDVWAKKEFNLEIPAAFETWLVFFAVLPGTNGAPSIEVNGRALACPPIRGDERVWHFRQSQDSKDSACGYLVGGAGFFYIPFPVDWLKKGRNEILFKAGAGDAKWRLGLSDYRNFQKGAGHQIDGFPHASQKTSDRGVTWSKKLGPEADLEGEYMVRICLKRYRPRGSLTSPVIPLAPLSDVIPIRTRIDSAEVILNWEQKTPDQTRIDWHVRSGKTPFYGKTDWSEWEPYRTGARYTSKGGYFQWKAVFSTQDPLQTPQLVATSVRAMFTSRPMPWADRITVESLHNEPIRHSAVPYEYEQYDRPELKTLRVKFELDALLDGAGTEFQKIQRLMHWAYAVPLTGRFEKTLDFSWNALDYCRLERNGNGEIRMQTYPGRRRDEFCLISNLALVQACLSFGITARHVGIGGHEVCEAWSNDYKKWVFLDATRDFYYVDQVTDIPLSTLDLHNVNAGNRDWRKILMGDNATPQQKTQVADAEKDPERLFAVAIRGGDNPHPVEKNFGMERTDYFRIIPRNNFLSKLHPLPLNQGSGGMPWPWDGYLNWKDAFSPGLLHYSTFTDRPRDMYPDLNQVEFSLEFGEQEGTLVVYLDTVTPGFKTFMVKLDDDTWKESGSVFHWKLKSGTNALEVCSEDIFGKRGIISRAVLNFVENEHHK